MLSELLIKYNWGFFKPLIAELYLYLLVGLAALGSLFYLTKKFLKIKYKFSVSFILLLFLTQYFFYRHASTINLLSGIYPLSSQIGIIDKEARQIKGDGKNGFLVYGPYMPLSKGVYEVIFRVKTDNFTNQAQGFCDVNVLEHNESNTKAEITLEGFKKQNPQTISLLLMIPEGNPRTEFRVFQYGGNNLTLVDLHLAPAGIREGILRNKGSLLKNTIYLVGIFLFIGIYLKFLIKYASGTMRKTIIFSTLASLVSGLIMAYIWQSRGFQHQQWVHYYDMWRGFYAPVWLPLMFIFFYFLYLLTMFFGFKRDMERFLRYDSWTVLIFPLFIVLELSLAQFHRHLVLGNLYLVPLVIKASIYFVFIWQNLQQQEHSETHRAMTIFLSIFTLYLLITPWVNAAFHTDGDETVYMLMGQSLVNDNDFDITNNVLQDDCLSYHPAVRWTGWQGMFTRPLVSALIAPGILMAGRFGAVLTQIMMASFLLTIVFLVISQATNSAKAAFLAMIATAFSCPLGIYATLIFPEIIAAAIVTYLLFVLMSKKSVRYIQIIVYLSGAFTLLFLKERYSVLSLFSILLFSMYKLEKKKHKVLAFGLIVAGIGAFVLYDKLVWQWINIQRFVRYFEEATNGFSGIFSGAMGLLFDQETGLFIHTPLYVCGLLGLLSFWPKQKRELIILISMFVPYFLLISLVPMWSSFGSPPPRYLVAVMPVLAVGIGVFFSRVRRAWIKLMAILAAVWSLVLYYLFILIPQTRVPNPNISSGRNQIFDWLYAKTYFSNISVLFPSFLKPSTGAYLLSIFFAGILIIIAVLYKRQESESAEPLSVAILKKQGGVIIVIICGVLLVAQLAFNNALEYKAGECYAGGAYRTAEGWQLLHGVQEFVLTKISLRKGEKVAITIRAKPVSDGETPMFTVYDVTAGKDRMVGDAALHNKDWQDYHFRYTAGSGNIHFFKVVHTNYQEGKELYIDTISFRRLGD